MTMQIEGRALDQAAGSRIPLRSWLANGFNRWLKYRSRKRTAAALRALDDRMLQDVGLHRSEIMAAAYLGATPARRAHREVQAVPLAAGTSSGQIRGHIGSPEASADRYPLAA